MTASRRRAPRLAVGPAAAAVRTLACGASAAASIGFALLVAGTVFISIAVPRASLGQRNRALQHAMATAPATSATVVGTSDYDTFDGVFGTPTVTAGDIGRIRATLAGSLTRLRLPLRQPAAWSSLSTSFSVVTGAAAWAVNSGIPPRMEFVYRDTLGRYSRLVSGRMPGLAHSAPGRTVLQIAVTAPTAARFGLRPGSRLSLAPGVALQVTGIIRVASPDSAFWQTDPVAAAPELTPPSPPMPGYWIGAAFIGPAELPLLANLLPTGQMVLTWVYPLNLGHVTVGSYARLQAELNAAVSTGSLVAADSPVSALVPFSSGLIAVLAAFSAEDRAIGSVLSLLFVSLAVIGIVVILLGAGLLAGRRSGEFAVLRARGAALRQVAGRALAAAALLALPGAAVAAAAAVAVTPGGSLSLAWWLAAGTLAAALAGLPALAVARLRGAEREARRRRAGRAAAARRTAAARRLVIEAALVAAAVGGIVVLRRQGLSAGTLNVFSSAAPALVAIPAAIVVVRAYPVVLRLLLRLTGPRPGVSAFVGLASAARTSMRAVGPVFALILALAVVTFGTMIGAAVRRGEIAASWQQTGADAIVNAATSLRAAGPAAQRAIAAVPGAAVTAGVTGLPAALAGGTPVTVAAVSPARYAALIAATPEPAFPAAALARRPGPVPALATPAAAAALTAHPGPLLAGGRRLAVRVAGRLSQVPGIAPGPLLVLPDWALGPAAAPPTVILVAGPQLDGRALTAVVRRLLPGAVVTLRSQALAALSNAPLPHGADVSIVQSAVAAAGFSALILLISLLITARTRELTLARLATMGLGQLQARWLTVVETLPQVLAATAGGVACAWALAPLLGPAIDLSAFTGTGRSVPILAEPAPLAVCAAGLIALAALALAVQPVLSGQRGAARALRIED